MRSAVANTDDPDMPSSTFRAWFIGIIWAILIPGMNQFFFFRYPSVTVGGVRILSLSPSLSSPSSPLFPVVCPSFLLRIRGGCADR